jgi:predicted ATPase/Tfp pilus assembly protein PilF
MKPAPPPLHPGEYDQPAEAFESTLADQTASGLAPRRRGERYELRALLGRGGMGEVYRAWDKVLQREVAFKRVLPERADASALARFEQEARAGARLQHPGIPPIYDLGPLPEGNLFLTMRIIEGHTLRAEIDRAHRAGLSPSSLKRLVDCFARVCETLAFAHQQDILHRDIKPANIMLGDHGEVLVVDWGLAGLRSSGPAGTPAYIAPELLQSAARFDVRCEIYSLGALLYTILEGRAPYRGESAEAIFSAARAGPPAPLGDHLPGALVAITERAMARDPGARFPAVEALLSAVDEWRDGAARRARAAAAFSTAGAHRRRAEALSAEARRLHESAAPLLEAGASEEGWRLYERSLERLAAADLEQDEATTQLQLALIYDPEHTSTHEQLAEQLLAERDRALAGGADRAARRAERQALTHLELAGAAGRTAPAQRLAPPDAPLIGRGALLAAAEAEFQRGGRLVTLSGAAGVGKTRLAQELADRSDATVYFCELREARTRPDILQIIARTLGIPLLEGAPAHQVVTALRARGQVMLVLDNIEQLIQSTAELVSEWLMSAPQLRLLLTGRSQLKLSAERSLSVPPLPTLDAIALFLQRGRRARADFALTPDNRALVHSLVRQLDNLPLALELAAARLSQLPLLEISARLSERLELLRGRLRDPQARSLEAALQWSWELLEPRSRAALAGCSVFRGGFTSDAARAILGTPQDALSVLDTLSALTDDNLLQRRGDRYDLLESVRVFARSRLDPGAAAAAMTRHARHYAALGSLENLHRRPLSHDARSHLYQERANLLAAANRANGSDSALCALGLVLIFNARGPYSEAEALLTQIHQRPVLDEEIRGRLEMALAQYIHWQGRLESAEVTLLRALERFRALASRTLEAAALNLLGTFKLDRGQVEEAEVSLQRSLALHRELGNRQGEGMVLANLGLVHERQNLWDQAGEFFVRSLEIVRAEANLTGEGRVLSYLGEVYRKRGQHEEAIRYFLAARAICLETRDHKLLAETMNVLGLLHKSRGEPEVARRYLTEALARYSDLGLRRGIAAVRGNLGLLEMNHGRLADAEAHYLAALAIHRDLGTPRGEGIVQGNLGLLYARWRRVEASEEAFSAALALRRSLGDRRGVGFTLSLWGELYRELGQHQRALGLYREALAIHREFENRIMEGETLTASGICTAALGNRAEAREHYTAALAIFRAVGARRSEGISRFHLATLHQEGGEHDSARRQLDRGEALLREVSDAAELARLLCFRGQLHLTEGDRPASEAALAEAQALAAGCGSPDRDLSERLSALEARLSGA